MVYLYAIFYAIIEIVRRPLILIKIDNSTVANGTIILCKWKMVLKSQAPKLKYPKTEPVGGRPDEDDTEKRTDMKKKKTYKMAYKPVVA